MVEVVALVRVVPVMVAGPRVAQVMEGWVVPVRVAQGVVGVQEMVMVEGEVKGRVALMEVEEQVMEVVVLGMVAEEMEELMEKGDWEMVEVRGLHRVRVVMVMVVRAEGVVAHTMLLFATRLLKWLDQRLAVYRGTCRSAAEINSTTVSMVTR
jgi:hypothetical protein